MGRFFYGDVIFGRLKKTLLPQAKTHVFFKESLLKLNLHRSRLYEQLRRRPNQHFAQNYILYPNGTLKLAPDCKNRRKMRTQKMRAPGARNTEECLYTLHYTLFKEKLLLLLLQAAMPKRTPRSGPRNTFSNAVFPPVFGTIWVFASSAHMAENDSNQVYYCFS